MRKIIANIGWIFFDKIFRMMVGMLVSVWIARYLGPAEFGVLNYAMLFPTFFAALASFGLTTVLIVDLVAANDDPVLQQRLVQTGLVVKIVAGCLTYALSCGLNYISNRDNPELFLLINVAGATLILQSSDIIDTYFQSQTKAKLSVVVKLVAFGLASLVRVYALLTHQGILFLVLINVTELIVVYILITGVYQRHVSPIFKQIRLAINYQLIRQLMRVAWPIMLTEFFLFVYMKVDQFMIESLSTNHELGLYSAALRLSETWYFVSYAITTSFYPKIASFWDTNRAIFYENYQQLLNLLIYTSVGIGILTSCFADSAINLMYGEKFNGAGIILSIHIWTGLFVYIGVGTSNLFIINNLQQFVLGRTIVGVFINIGLNWWLIPRYGAVGASMATLIAQFFAAYALNFFYPRAKPIFYLQSRALLSVLTLRKPVLTYLT